jgi:tetratricopeptide (TPR) repeat protein
MNSFGRLSDNVLMNDFSCRRASLGIVVGCCCLATMATGCRELRGRRHVREGNRLYREGHYTEALERYRRAEALAPALPLLWLNEGLTCRQLMIPGARTIENRRAVDCAVAAFGRLKQVAPSDPRGEQMYLQTLFDGDRFEMLVARYGEQLKRNSGDLAAINGIIQVYSRWNRPEDALAWYQRKAALLSTDAEAQYAVGVFVWQQLYQKGGGPDKASFDPRVDPADAANAAARAHRQKRASRRAAAAAAQNRKPPPVFSLGDITGSARVALAGIGIVHLERALALRPSYREAMVYLNLLHRQKSMAYFDQPELWQSSIDTAEQWRRRAERERPAEVVNGQHHDARSVDGAAGASGNVAAEKGTARSTAR